MASSAPIRRPNITSSKARAGPINAGSRCKAPDPGTPPRPISGKPRTAEASATRRSQASANSAPPPKTYPWRAATLGRGERANRSKTSQVFSMKRRNDLPSSCRMKVKSAPLENALSPAPERTITETPGSVSRAPRCEVSSSHTASSMALRTRGRFKRRWAMAPLCSSSTDVLIRVSRRTLRARTRGPRQCAVS